MAYDEDLADRIRELIADEADLTERKMFGGLAFLIGGHMAVAASGQGGVLVRVDPAESDALVATTSARPMEMRGRQMQGWLRVDPEDLRTKRSLAKWVELGTTYARSPARQAVTNAKPGRQPYFAGRRKERACQRTSSWMTLTETGLSWKEQS